MYDPCEDRTRAAVSLKSTSWPAAILLSANTTHRKHMHVSTVEEKEVVVTDDGPQPPIKQLE